MVGLSDEERLWTNMISWLESKGFDSRQLPVVVRTRDGAGRALYTAQELYTPSKPFLRIPQAALLNSRSLKQIYPKIALEGYISESSTSKLVLNGTQLLSLHLAIYRPQGESDSQDPDFGPYLSTLPRTFDGHPLCWLVRKGTATAAPTELEFLRQLPPSAFVNIETIYRRYKSDWDVVKQCLIIYTESLPTGRRTIDEEDFLWGWLAVNTRCLYCKIFSQALPYSDLTMCPLVDLANHTASDDVPLMRPKKHEQKPGKRLPTDFVFMSPERPVRSGEEIFLRYGNHCNRFLFAEYGFVDEHAAKEVEVSDILVELIARKPISDRRLKLLESEGHLSDLSVYTSPTPTQPTWRLVCALRLANLELPDDEGEDALDHAIQPWREVLCGFAENISEANDSAARNDVKLVAEVLQERSSRKLHELEKCIENFVNGGWECWVYHAITKLWEEERVIANGLAETLASGYALE